MGRRGSFICPPFSREKGGARLFFAGAAPPPPRRRAPIPLHRRFAPRERAENRPPAEGREGKGEKPPLPGAKKLPLQGGGSPRPLRQGAFVCRPTDHFWGSMRVEEGGDRALMGRRDGFICSPFSRERGAHGCFLQGPRRSPPRQRAPIPLHRRFDPRERAGNRPPAERRGTGKGEKLPSLPKGKEIALAGRRRVPILSVRGPSFAVPQAIFGGACGSRKGETGL